jgi:hypothetical protein
LRIQPWNRLFLSSNTIWIKWKISALMLLSTLWWHQCLLFNLKLQWYSSSNSCQLCNLKWFNTCKCHNHSRQRISLKSKFHNHTILYLNSKYGTDLKHKWLTLESQLLMLIIVILIRIIISCKYLIKLKIIQIWDRHFLMTTMKEMFQLFKETGLQLLQTKASI